MGPEVLKWHTLQRNKISHTSGHDIPQKCVVEQASYSGLHHAPDQEQDDTCITVYETITSVIGDVDPHYTCVHFLVGTLFK
jgi:hypothetical protein